MTPTFGHAMLSHWALDPDILYLNHGTVGATPRRVLAVQKAILDEMERQPARFMLRELADVKKHPLRARSRTRVALDAIAPFVGARVEDLAFVDNATTGMNSVLRSIRFEPGDEILFTDHAYGAILNTARYVAGRCGASVRVVELPAPPFRASAIVEAIDAEIGPRTRMLVVDHITSGSALVLPLAEIAARCRARKVAVLADGAHAPGAIALDIPALGVDWYVGNLHKWAMAPRGCGILWAAPAWQPDLHPTVISWGYERGFDAEFDLLGTRNPSMCLAAPEGIAFMNDLGGAAMRAYDHDLAWRAAGALAERWGVTLPMEESMIGTMVTLPLPERFGTTEDAAWQLKDVLLYGDGIEAQMHGWRGRIWLRISAQVYNEDADYERLARAIESHA